MLHGERKSLRSHRPRLTEAERVLFRTRQTGDGQTKFDLCCVTASHGLTVPV